MAYTEPTDPTTGELITASWWKTDNGDNLRALRLGAVAMASQAQYDLVQASSSTQFARVAGVADAVLVTDGSKVPTLSATLPTAVQDNVTRLGAVTVCTSLPLTTFPAGAGSETIYPAGLFVVDDTQAATPASTAETALATITVPANSLSATGRTIRVVAVGTSAANGNIKQVSIRWGSTGGTIAASVDAANSGAPWRVEACITRLSTGSQRLSGIGYSSVYTLSPKITVTTAAEDETTARTIVITGINDVASASDIVYEASWTEMLN